MMMTGKRSGFCSFLLQGWKTADVLRGIFLKNKILPHSGFFNNVSHTHGYFPHLSVWTVCNRVLTPLLTPQKPSRWWIMTQSLNVSDAPIKLADLISQDIARGLERWLKD